MEKSRQKPSYLQGRRNKRGKADDYTQCLGLPDPNPSIIKKKIGRKTLISCEILNNLLSLKNDVNVSSKSKK